MRTGSPGYFNVKNSFQIEYSDLKKRYEQRRDKTQKKAGYLQHR